MKWSWPLRHYLFSWAVQSGLLLAVMVITVRWDIPPELWVPSCVGALMVIMECWHCNFPWLLCCWGLVRHRFPARAPAPLDRCVGYRRRNRAVLE
ncbi:hypothetical protein B9Z19DRAFT_1076645 [Tuber borchii]|uniref:Uncharacterized protein n=1 Tax=Tuber borchii TaxID=42251 RepID=A0A2T7A1P8_TUBBO|nr:hypothetical protein B9Z19DRAFT_1076645 [Tuber borchii]